MAAHQARAAHSLGIAERSKLLALLFAEHRTLDERAAEPAAEGLVGLEPGDELRFEPVGDLGVPLDPVVRLLRVLVEAYDLANGLLSTLIMPVPFAGACKIPGIPAPLYQDDRILLPGDGFYYLVEGINGCGDGGMGAGTTTPNYRDLLQSAPACL